MNINLTGKVALVNAASQGIGKAIALGLSKAGADVCITARTTENLKSTADFINTTTGGKVVYYACNLIESSASDEVYNYINSVLRNPDILINNVGGPKQGSFFDLSSNDFQVALETSLLTTINFTRRFAPTMLSNKWGRIINISSTIAKEPTPSMIVSATARAGLSAFSKALSIELAPHGVTINTLCPGGVLTDRLRTLLKDKSEAEDLLYEELLIQSTKSIPLGRFANTDEFANIATFLSSDFSSYITGTIINVDGGLTKSI